MKAVSEPQAAAERRRTFSPPTLWTQIVSIRSTLYNVSPKGCQRFHTIENTAWKTAILIILLLL